MEPSMLREVQRIIEHGEKDSDRLKAMELALAYGRGKPTQSVEVSGPGGESLRPEVSLGEVLADPVLRAALLALAEAELGVGVSSPRSLATESGPVRETPVGGPVDSSAASDPTEPVDR